LTKNEFADENQRLQKESAMTAQTLQKFKECFLQIILFSEID